MNTHFAACLLSTLLLALPALAADVYVSTSGDDNNGNGSAQAPYRTIVHAVESLGSAGGTVHVADGEYEETSSAASIFTLNGPIQIVGESGHPERAIVRYTGTTARIAWLAHADARIANLTLHGGYAGSGNGGGNVYIDSAGGTLENCILYGGYEKSWAGGGGNLYMVNGHVNRCQILAGFCNNASGASNIKGGCGVYATGGIIENSLFASNGVVSAAVRKGDLTYMQDANCGKDGYAPCTLVGTAKMVNCTVVDNRACGCGGIRLLGSASAVNCAVFRNTLRTEETGAATVFLGDASAFTNCACDAGVSIGGPGCVSGDPRFTDPESSDYSIGSEFSVLIDAGADATAAGATSTLDLAGNDRITKNAIDIGCYEFVQNAVLPLNLDLVCNGVSATFAPAEATFTASTLGAVGTVTFSWDFDGDGTPDLVGTDASVTWTFADRGTFVPSVTAVDAETGNTATATLADPIVLRGVIYVDSAAAAGGHGTQTAPFRTLREALAGAHDSDTILLRGGDDRAYPIDDDINNPIVLSQPNLVIGRWGDGAKPVLTAETLPTAFGNFVTIVEVAGAGTTFENLAVRCDAEAVAIAITFCIEAADVTFRNCDFTIHGLENGNNGRNGVIRCPYRARAPRLRVEGCTFSEFFNTSSQRYTLIGLGDDAVIVGNTFSNCASVVSIIQSGITGFQFVSNNVINTANAALSGYDSAALVYAGANAFAGPVTIAFNRFVNARKGGCAIHESAGSSPAFAGGLDVHNNTVVGYDTFHYREASGSETYLYRNNLLANTDSLLYDCQSAPSYTGDTVFQGNAVEGAAVIAGASSDYDPAATGATISGNRLLSGAPDFVSRDFADSNAYSPNRLSHGWVFDDAVAFEGGAGYVGAVAPHRQGMVIFVNKTDDNLITSKMGWRVTTLDPTHLLLQYDCQEGEAAAFSMTDRELLLTGWKFDNAFAAEANIAQSGRAQRETQLRSGPFTVSGDTVAAHGFYTQPVGQSYFPKSPGGRLYPVTLADLVYNVYIVLDTPLEAGVENTLNVPGASLRFAYDPDVPSPIFKVNQVGYMASAAERYAYLGAWLGTLGPMPAPTARAYELVDTATGGVVFRGTFVHRLDDPVRNGVAMVGEDVLEADFSAFSTPGTYFIRVPGVGRSMDFRISDDAAGDQFAVHMLGLFNQRCGCAKEEPHTHWTDAACHTTVWRGVEAPYEAEYSSCYRNANGDAVSTDHFTINALNMDAVTNNPANALHIPGGWHDAADYDRRTFHLRIAGDLAMLYLMKPENFTDSQLAMPERGNGIPDILDEADWGLRHILASQRADGGAGTWIETTRHPDAKDQWMPSEDNLLYFLATPTRNSTLEYVGYAALLARALESVGTPEASARAALYRQSAIRGWAFGTQPRLAPMPVIVRGPDGTPETGSYQEPADIDVSYYMKAAINLAALTGDDSYLAGVSEREQELERYVNANDWKMSHYAFAELKLADHTNPVLKKLYDYYVNRTRYNADPMLSQLTNSTPYRVPWYGANDWHIEQMSWGAVVPLRSAQTLCLAHWLTGERKYLDAAYLACDFQTGCNPNGSTWTSGLGTVYPARFLSLHSAADAIAEYVPGITPYRNQYAIHYRARDLLGEPYTSEANAKPLWRRWENIESLTVSASEYTVWETIAPCAATMGYLMAPNSTPNLDWKQPAATYQDIPGYWAMP